MKPSVVILSAFLTPFRSGAEACAEEVAKRLSDQFDITVVTARLRRELPKFSYLDETVPVVRVGLGFGIDKWLFPFIAPFVVRSLRPDIVHAVLETFAGLALHFCKYLAPSSQCMLTLQTTNRSFLKGPIIRSPDKVTAISNALVKQAKELGRDDVIRIPNGADLAQIREACVQYKKVPGRILFVGRLEPMKGIDTLFDAFARIVSKRVPHHLADPRAYLHIVGDGSEREYLQGLASNFRIKHRTDFLGYLGAKDTYKEFAEAEIFCGLSRSEALGNVFIEAQAAGCAVIGTTVGGIPDIVQDDVTGFLIESDDETAAELLLRKLLRDDELCERLAQAAQKNAQQYDWGIIAKQYAEHYKTLI